jgi:RNA polymerase subunit RPABC4/transcription elongation factor Spt4
MWVIDIRHWLGENLMDAGLPQLRFKVKKLGEIVSYATAIEAGISVDFQPECWRRPKRKACKGELDIDLDSDTDKIHWRCPKCGDEGVVTGWKGLIWDLSDSSKEPLQ